MTREQQQLIALCGVFEAAALVEKLATTGQLPAAPQTCLLQSLLVQNPKDTLDVYGGDHYNLRDGMRTLQGALQRTPEGLPREAMRYALTLLNLQRQLDRKPEMLALIGKRLPQIGQQAEMFGITHDNVVAAFAGLYQDTLSTFRQRLQIHGEMHFLQDTRNAARIRALLLAGIRSAMLWRQLGGHRWHLLLYRGRMLKELQLLLRN